MPAVQKLRCVVERVAAHEERVYTVMLRPERRVPRFLAGQFLHLALDPYDPGGFWPESRVFSIASAPASAALSITYAVHGPYTERMAHELAPGRTVWIKLPYGDFLIHPGRDAVLFAGGTGITAFTAYLEQLSPEVEHQVLLAYGARSQPLLIYRDLVRRRAAELPGLQAMYFSEDPRDAAAAGISPGRVSVDAVWPRIRAPHAAHYYIAGPPAMIQAVRLQLHDRGIASEAIHVDAWE